MSICCSIVSTSLPRRMARGQWVSLQADGVLNWKLVAQLVDRSYRTMLLSGWSICSTDARRRADTNTRRLCHRRQSTPYGVVALAAVRMVTLPWHSDGSGLAVALKAKEEPCSGNSLPCPHCRFHPTSPVEGMDRVGESAPRRCSGCRPF
jgi:hypothetical protein